jgi:hypothetical protein
MTIGIRRYFVVLFALIMFVGAANAETLWSIGREDGSYSEFAIAGKHADYSKSFPNDVNFVVGKSKPCVDWSFIQPGMTDAWAGSKEHPFRIEFKLSRAPKTALRLIVASVSAHGKIPPMLDVNVNDAEHVDLQFEPGSNDEALTDPKEGKKEIKSYAFAPNLFHAGRNVITLTSRKGSWLLFDAVSLESLGSAGPEIATFEAECTPFFKNVDGGLKQAVRVGARNVGLAGEVEIALAGAPESALKTKLEQGENELTLLVAPFTETAAKKIEANYAGKKSEAEFTAQPERHWKIFVAPSSHTDIGYTDLQEKIFELHNNNTDAILAACEKNPSLIWNMEVFAQADWYYKRGPEAFKKFVEQARAGRIGLTSLFLNMLTGLCTGDEMALVLEPAQKFGRACGVSVPVATITDVPTTVGTLPMFLNHAGVRYFAEGVNEDRGPVFHHSDRRMIQSPFWWEGLDGSRVLTVLTRSYAQAQVMGLREDVAALEQRLSKWIHNIDYPEYPGDAIYGNGGCWDNNKETGHYIDVAEEWNKTWAFPQIIVSRPGDFFEYVEKNYGASLPTFRGDMGSYWEDGAASSAQETGNVRIAKAQLNAASKWRSLAAVMDEKAVYPRDAFSKAWEDAIYYDEHTWGAAGSITTPMSDQTVKQWAYKSAYANRAKEEAAQLFANDAVGEASGVSKKGETVTVSNSCSWARDIKVTIPDAGAGVVAKDKATGRIAPSWNLNGKAMVFLAEQIPGLGCRRYELIVKKGEKEPLFLKKGADSYTWETPAFRYKIDPKTGAFSSIVDLKTKREWVDASSGYGVNQFLYVKGGEGTSLVHSGGPAAPSLVPLTHTEAAVEMLPADKGLLPCLCIVRKGAGVPTVTTVCWFYMDGHVDFENVVDKEETMEREGGYFAFPIKLDAPDRARTFFDESYGVVEADVEQPAGASREWYAANSFGAVSDDGISAYVATREAPLFTVGMLNRGAWPAKVENNRGTIFAYVFNNYWHTNYKAAQGGSLPFSFSMKFSEKAFDPVEGTKFGWDYLNIGSLTSLVKTRGAEESFVKVSEGPVLLAELTQAGDATHSWPECTRASEGSPESRCDRGRLLARLYNPSFSAAKTTIELPKIRLKGAESTDLFGCNGKALEVTRNAVTVEVPARGIATVALEACAK